MTKTHTSPGETAAHLITVPVSIRLPGDLAIKLYRYSEEMNTSPAKLITSILEDTLPSFDSGRHEIKLRISQVYKAMEDASLTYSVNLTELTDRVMSRAEPGGPMGRPRKSR